MTKAIHLNLDLKETFKRLDTFVLIHNDKVKKTKEGKRVCSSALSTAKTMLRMYYKHLQNASRKMMSPGVFKCNNVALATMMQYNKSTGYRHVTKLLQAGVIQHKVWHGSNSSYEIHFNTDLLVAETSPIYTDWLTRSAQALNKHVAFDTILKIKSIRPSFSSFPTGLIPSSLIENCHHTETVKILQEQNINITVETVDKMLLEDVFLQEQGSCETIEQLENPQISHFTEPATNDLTPGGAAQKNTVEKPLISSKTVEKHAMVLYQMAINLLWENKHYEPEEHETAQRYIEYFLSGGSKNVTIDQIYHRKSNFITRILLVRNYLNRNIGTYVVNPALYFNPNYAHGFSKTKSWLEAVRLNQKKNKEYHSHIKILIDSWKEYTNNPTLEVYTKQKQRIGKLKNTQLMNVYNRGILSPEVMTENGMRSIRNEVYNIVN